MAQQNNSYTDVRKKKLEAIRELGINPYPPNYKPTTTTERAGRGYAFGEAIESNLDPESRIIKLKKEGPLQLAGRILAYRDMGKVIFADIQDSEGRIQVYFNKKRFESKHQKLLDLLDLGDFIGVRGSLFRTNTGEITVNVEEYELLTKSLLPMPDKRKGIQDPELKYRRRNEMLTADPNLRENFVIRARAISAMREYLDSKGFLEVETPILQRVYGGASAKPFKTHVNALGEDVFLSISPELYLKRMISAGFDRVYTICKNFRNEGIDRFHNPEFTMMECYQAYADYDDMMRLTEGLYAHIFEVVLGKTKVKHLQHTGHNYGNETIELDFSAPWRREKMTDLVAREAHIDVISLTEEQLREKVSKLEDPDFFKSTVPREDLHKWSWGELVQGLFNYYCEDEIIQPTFVIDHPKETTPLCKISRYDPRLIERFEPFVNGLEIGNAYSELNDPIRQRELLEEQVRNRTSDEIPGQIDEEFCRAIEFGIPPTGGLGLGIDRLAMLLTNAYSIKDVIFFPLLKDEK